MSYSFDLYVERVSWLHSLDARVKLLFVIAASAVLLAFNNLFLMLAALAAAHAVLFSAGIPRRKILWVWRMMLPITILIPSLWVIFYREGGTQLLSFWFIRITTMSLAHGLSVALRVDSLAFVFFVWLFSTDQTLLVRSLVKLGLPYEWGLMIAIAFRYLPTFYGVFTVISEAQQARALDLSKGGLLKKGRAYLPIMIAMMITALRTTENLSKALEARAFRPGMRRTSLKELHARPVDCAAMVIILAGAALLLWARFSLGFGSQPWSLL
jgi:energy-coupling factor transport system permease protein